MADRPRTTMSTTYIVDLLLADHEEAKALLGRFDHLAPTERAAYFSEVVTAIVRHEVAEEHVVYPIIRTAIPDGVQEATARLAEESKTEQLLANMEKLDATSVEFATQFSTLRKAVLDHAISEETSTFPLLNEMEDPESRRALGGLYELAKAKAPTHPHPHVPDSPPGNLLLDPIASLFDRARDALRDV
jgi:hemerythrin superfamily protein